jgi:hypothetical protein
MSNVKPIAMPICELADRLTIAQLKKERLPNSEIDKDDLQKQIKYYEEGIDTKNEKLRTAIVDLYEINGQMWDAEHAIRKGLDEDLGLSEIGRRALKIRDLNRVRVSIKNKITEIAGQPEFADCKMNHASS